MKDKFSNGLLYPGDKNDSADEVINCRCACLQMAKWALDEDELNTLKQRANYFGLDKTENFEDFKTKYLSAVDNSENDIYNGKKDNNSVELFRKSNIDGTMFKCISDKRFEELTIEAKKLGATILRGTEDIEKHLTSVNASASIINDCILFRKNVTVSDVLEETKHYIQNVNGINLDKGEPLRTYLNEIEVKEFLIQNVKKYNIPRVETELTEKQLKSYKKLLNEYNEGK